METLSIATRRREEIVDITDLVQQHLATQKASNGLVYLMVMHTTAALTTADLDPGTDLDMLAAFRAMIPRLKFRHPHDPAHVPDHILSSLIGPAVVVPFASGSLVLGTWQRIVLVEFDGPRARMITVSLITPAASS